MNWKAPHPLEYSRTAPSAWWRRPAKSWFQFIGWLLVFGPIVVMLLVMVIGLASAVVSPDLTGRLPDGSTAITVTGSRWIELVRLLLCVGLLVPFSVALWYAFRKWSDSPR